MTQLTHRVRVALANALLADAMVARFHGESRVKATELLLQERGPREAAAEPPRRGVPALGRASTSVFHSPQPGHFPVQASASWPHP